MYLLFDGDLVNPEIELSAPAEALVDLGNQLKELTHDLEIVMEKGESKYYSETLEGAVFRIVEINSSSVVNLITMRIENRKLYITGSQEEINNLGISILNTFDKNSQTNEHLHLDYFDGSIQKASLIVLCRNSVRW